MSDWSSHAFEVEGRRLWDPSASPEAPPESGGATSRVTRLLCARIYLFGLVASLPTVHRILGPSFRGIEPGVGYDRRFVLFHAFQSLLLSLAFLVPLVLVGCITPGSQCFPHFMVTCLFVKIALINPWIAWVHFREKSVAAEPRVPLIGDLARKLAELALPPAATARQNAVYFRGERPFVGYGTEMNAWTLVIDTTSKSQALGAFLAAGQPKAPLTARELYRAVVERVHRIQIPGLRVTAKLFLRGESSPEIKERHGYKYGRPPSTISKRLACEIDREGTQGRHYMILQCENPAQDLVVTQFVRFHESAKLIFCEFDSYVLSPASRGLQLLDRLFGLNRAVYAVLGVGLFVVSALVSTAASGVVEVVLRSPFPMALGVTELLLDVQRNLGDGAFAIRIVLASLALVTAVFALRLSGLVRTAVGMWAGARKDFGITWSYRERVATGMPLGHFERQEVIRFLKTHEKILTLAMVDCLEAHGIDTSDLKESISAFINQGIVNAGQFQGPVKSQIKRLFSRKARARASRGRLAYAAS